MDYSSFPVLSQHTVDNIYRTRTNLDYCNNQHSEAQRKHKLIPIVKLILNDYKVAPSTSWYALLLEWPHVSEDDPAQIAYYRDDRALSDGRCTRTTVGRYLTRHWAHIPSHLIRDWVGLAAPDIMEIRGETDFREIITALETGPQSCMKSSYGSIPFKSSDNTRLLAWLSNPDENPEPNWDRHPYRVYAPKYGWRMAVRYVRGTPHYVLGRALVNVAVEEKPGIFVRTYCRPALPEGWSAPDHILEAWLKSKGYAMRDGWEEGLKLRNVTHPTEDHLPMVPYIDGDLREVTDEGTYLRFDCHGTLKGCNTNAAPEDNSKTYVSCEDCEVDEDEDDICTVGRDEDRSVCRSCRDGSYTWVIGTNYSGRGQRRYWVHADDVSTCASTGEAYDENNLPHNIVLDADGNLQERENCVQCDDEKYRRIEGCTEVDGQWYEAGTEPTTEGDSNEQE